MVASGLRRPDQRPDLGRNTYCTGVVLSPQRQRIFELYWVDRQPQATIGQQLYPPVSQQTVSQHIDGIRHAYRKVGVELPNPKTLPSPRARVRKAYVRPGVVEIDVAALVNQLRQLGKTRSGTVSEGILLGTILVAIDNDTVQGEIARLVRPAAGPVGRRT